MSADDLVLDPKYAYVIVPHTIQSKVENDFLLRIFSKAEVRCLWGFPLVVLPCNCLVFALTPLPVSLARPCS